MNIRISCINFFSEGRESIQGTRTCWQQWLGGTGESQLSSKGHHEIFVDKNDFRSRRRLICPKTSNFIDENLSNIYPL